MNTAMYSQYEKKVHPCIKLIESLRALGIENNLVLPAIAVIGDQSSGKSSVLQALSGVVLPRGSGIVTRCPLEMNLKNDNEETGWTGKITYQDVEKELTYPWEVEQEIPAVQDLLAGDGKGISEELIRLEIKSCDVPDLTLIDLPGIARVAAQGQPEGTGEQSKRLIRKFIEKAETIILVVMPSNVDIATSEALKMAQDVDSSGERTLGILTKPDLVDKSDEDNVVKIVHNKVVELKKGYTIVKYGRQEDTVENPPLAQVYEEEKSFFETRPQFRSLLDEGKATTECLAERIVTEFVEHITKMLPMLEQQVEDKLKEASEELEKYGNGVPTDELEQISYLIEKLGSFSQSVMNITTGEETEGSHRCKKKMFTKVFTEFRLWKSYLEKSVSTFQEKMRKEVFLYERKYQGRELSGFINYKTLESIVKQQITQLEMPAIKILTTVAEIIRHTFSEIATSNFSGLPNLIKAAKDKIQDLKQQQEEQAEAMLRTQFKMEQIVYTQYNFNSSSLSDTKEYYHNPSPDSKDNNNSLFCVPSVPLYTFGMSSNASIQEVLIQLQSYYTIASRRLADQIPLIILHFLLQEYKDNFHQAMLQLLQDKDQVNEFLKEDRKIADARQELKHRIQHLTQALHCLAKFT